MSLGYTVEKVLPKLGGFIKNIKRGELSTEVGSKFLHTMNFVLVISFFVKKCFSKLKFGSQFEIDFRIIF